RRQAAPQEGPMPPRRQTFSIGYFVLVALALVWLQSLLAPPARQVPYSEFKQMLGKGWVERVLLSDTLIRAELKPEHAPDHKSFVTGRVPDEQLVPELQEKGVLFEGQYESPILNAIVSWVLPAAVFVGIWAFAMRRMGPGAGVMAFTKSRARIYAEKETGVTFADVAGEDEAKEELQEIILFLKEPGRYRVLGGKLPKGVL